MENIDLSKSGKYGITQSGDVYEVATGKKLSPEEFRSLGLNAQFLPRVFGPGQAADTQSDPTAGLPPELKALYDRLDKYLQELQSRGQAVNPNIEITPEQISEFTAQAQREIDPYYSSQLKLAREGFLKSTGYAEEDVLRNEKELEQRYGRQLRDIGASAAEKGFAMSGVRGEEERLLAQDTQKDIDTGRRTLGRGVEQAARTFAQQYGATALPTRSLQMAPSVTPGAGFQRPSAQSPYYSLSPEVYDGLVGEQEFTRRGAVRSRASQLEEAYRTKQGINQARQLNL